jgi:ribosomal protein S18 acetylase RimI-like enzyme
MTETTYRRALHTDLPTIVAFQLAMARETEELELDEAVCTRGVQAVFAREELGQYFVAEQHGQVVASLLITYEWSDWRNGMVWWIQSVYVHPAARQQGIYAGLYAHIKALVQADETLRGIRLYVDTRNQRAQVVYTRLGMNGEHYRVFEWMKS